MNCLLYKLTSECWMAVCRFWRQFSHWKIVFALFNRRNANTSTTTGNTYRFFIMVPSSLSPLLSLPDSETLFLSFLIVSCFIFSQYFLRYLFFSFMAFSIQGWFIQDDLFQDYVSDSAFTPTVRKGVLLGISALGMTFNLIELFCYVIFFHYVTYHNNNVAATILQVIFKSNLLALKLTYRTFFYITNTFLPEWLLWIWSLIVTKSWKLSMFIFSRLLKKPHKVWQ